MPQDETLPLIERRATQLTLHDVETHVEAKLEPIRINITNISDTVKSMVPNGDFTGHRVYHETKIEDEKDRKKVFSELRKEVIGYIVKGLMMGIGVLVLLGAQTQLSIWNSKPVVDVQRAVPSTPQAPVPVSKGNQP